MQLTNVVEILVWQKMEEILPYKPDMCKCEKCRADIAAYALNKLRPRYVVTNKGEAFTRAEFLSAKYSAELIVAVTEAIEIVSLNPRHEE